MEREQFLGSAVVSIDKSVRVGERHYVIPLAAPLGRLLMDSDDLASNKVQGIWSLEGYRIHIVNRYGIGCIGTKTSG